MFCKECGAEIPDESKYCPECGASLSSSSETEKTKIKEKDIEKSKSMGIALLISIILSGLGVAYAGNTKKGLLIFIGFIIGFIILPLIGFIIWVYGLYATYIEINHSNNVENNHSIEKIRTLSNSTKILWLIIILILVIFASVGMSHNSNDNSNNYHDDSSNVDVDNTSNDNSNKDDSHNNEFNKSEYELFNYGLVNKNPYKYINDKVYASGEVFQIQESGSTGFMLLSVDGDTSQNVYVSYAGSNDIVEGDTVTVYGHVSFNHDYESRAGYKLSVPAILADKIEKS